jgi:hypothetical protein
LVYCCFAGTFLQDNFSLFQSKTVFILSKMARKKQWGCLLILLTGIALSWGVYECKYYYSKWSDYRNSPWAYSRDEQVKLLVGHWKGSFTDPNRVKKAIELEVFVPLTDEERQNKAGRRWKRASYSTRNKHVFDGIAKVTSRLGQEKYEITGQVGKDDFHQLTFDFLQKEKKDRVLPNFVSSKAKNGHWEGDVLEATLSFSYFRADGSAFYSSADPRHDKEVHITLKRVSNPQ